MNRVACYGVGLSSMPYFVNQLRTPSDWQDYQYRGLGWALPRRNWMHTGAKTVTRFLHSDGDTQHKPARAQAPSHRR